MRVAASRYIVMLLILLCSMALKARENPSPASLTDTILILDASGSMWGQIEGINKIVIAEDVVEELVRGLPAEQRLGLVAYGHRREGDCNDIQTIAGVGASHKELIKAIREISPKGKTPLTKSVEHAAIDLDYTRNAASVVLVSDGLENCDGDPCALARTLEEKGLDFTVHVIGFDVTVEERKGLHCIAEETGGEFLSADNASELTDAITRVVIAETAPAVEVESTPVPSSLALKASIMAGGPQINSQLSWTVRPKEGGDAVFHEENTGSTDTEIQAGDYVVDVVWTGWKDGVPKTGSMEINVRPQQPRVVTVPIDLDLPVILEAPDETPEGIAIPVTWSGPDSLNTTINVNRLDDDPLRKIYFFPAARARSKDKTAVDTNGDGDIDNDDKATALLGAPTIPGEYEIRYVLNDPTVILARKPLTVTDSQYELTVPETVSVSSALEINWSGPKEPAGVITLTDQGSTAAMNNKNYVRAVAGEPAKLTAPAIPGEYEIRYVMSGGYTTYPGMERSVQAAAPILITDVSASVSGPQTAVGGSTIEVHWQGPANGWQDDWVSLVTPGAEKYNRDSVIKLSKSGETPAPVQIRVPAIEGDYEIVYGLEPGGRVLVRQGIVVTRAEASVEVPDVLRLGEDIPVIYSGDGFSGDRVIITPADTPDLKMWGWGINYGFAAQPGQSEGTVRAGAVNAAGVYDVRYVTGLQHQVLARDTVTITE